MSLISKIFHEETPVATNHTLAALITLWLAGDTPSKANTVGDIETMFTQNNNGQAYTLTAGESNQLDELENHYNNVLGNKNARQDYLSKIERVFILAEHGTGVLIARPKFKTIIGFTTD